MCPTQLFSSSEWCGYETSRCHWLNSEWGGMWKPDRTMRKRENEARLDSERDWHLVWWPRCHWRHLHHSTWAQFLPLLQVLASWQSRTQEATGATHMGDLEWTVGFWLKSWQLRVFVEISVPFSFSNTYVNKPLVKVKMGVWKKRDQSSSVVAHPS